jgi:hypothetical protein
MTSERGRSPCAAQGGSGNAEDTAMAANRVAAGPNAWSCRAWFASAGEAGCGSSASASLPDLPATTDLEHAEQLSIRIPRAVPMPRPGLQIRQGHL